MKYERGFQKIFETHRFGSSGVKKKSFVLFSGVGEKNEGKEGGGQWAVAVLLLLKISFIRSNESQEYEFLQK